MAFIEPEIIGLARIKITTIGNEDGAPIIGTIAYDYANGFDTVEVAGALPGAAPIFVSALGTDFTLFLSSPQQPGNAFAAPTTLPSQGGVKATFNIVRVSTPTLPSPGPVNANTRVIDWQYGDYALSGLYSKVNPQKALRVFMRLGKTGETIYVDVSVLANPMTLYK